MHLHLYWFVYRNRNLSDSFQIPSHVNKLVANVQFQNQIVDSPDSLLVGIYYNIFERPVRLHSETLSVSIGFRKGWFLDTTRNTSRFQGGTTNQGHPGQLQTNHSVTFTNWSILNPIRMNTIPSIIKYSHGKSANNPSFRSCNHVSCLESYIKLASGVEIGFDRDPDSTHNATPQNTLRRIGFDESCSRWFICCWLISLIFRIRRLSSFRTLWIFHSNSNSFSWQ